MDQPQTARNVLIGVLAAAAASVLVTCGLGLAMVWLLWNAVSHITIDPAAVNDAVKTGIAGTLKDGTPEQKLDLIHGLRDLGAAAKPYATELTTALADDNAAVRAAAAEALKAIDPPATEKAGVK
ncbi:MAG TPA: hypothetical protein VGF55_07045 [Gemmataceae bacterium]|jgi:hypothetical protein